jgi:hypothetical protein
MAIGARAVAEDANVFWIFQDEIKAINERRRALGRPELPVARSAAEAGGSIDAVGLALSGGGVRSAAVCLGALQALNHNNALPNIDYLSTVSGGGYMGCSLTATMSKSGGEFVFGNQPSTSKDTPLAEDISDTDAVGHLRNYSNYLIPFGMRDALTGIAIVVRGLVANLGLVLPVVLIVAAITIWSNPDRSFLLRPDFFGISLEKYLPLRHFGLTLAFGLVALLLFFLWAIYRSRLGADKQSEFRTMLPSVGAGLLVLLAAILFCEFQPFVIAGMFEIAEKQAGLTGGVFFGLITDWVKTLAAIAAPVAAVVAMFRRQLGDLLKSENAASDWKTHILAAAAKAAVWVAGAALPLLIWVGYLYLSYWGIINDLAKPPPPAVCPPGVVSLVVAPEVARLNQDKTPDAKSCPGGATTEAIDEGSHTPRWLLTASERVSTFVVGRVIDRPMALLYFAVGVLLCLVSWLLTPNANSLHRLYRDRLSKAFLFDPTIKPGSRPKAGEASIDQGRDFAPLDVMRLSELSVTHAPYHLINAALNVQGSDFANRRGRNADFFLFSKYWIGSEATGYAPIEDFEPAVRNLDLATAMAISGAAASSNMGGSSIRPLTPTLAILNIRLGYWLRNPAFYAPTGAVDMVVGKKRPWMPMHRSTFFLWAEITGRLYENAENVYLTDGGHIENLGLYELLRRKCRYIIVVDAEADLAMHFPSLIRVQRYARIDLGVRINLPWAAIQKTTLAMMSAAKKAGDASVPERQCGPHVAIGTIDYGGGETGYLMYVKASLTGDENDYIRDYARRYARFPHESTGDQFFSEEQFEVYRALGFHMLHGALCGRDCIQAVGEDDGVDVRFDDEQNEAVRKFRAALIGAPAVRPQVSAGA